MRNRRTRRNEHGSVLILTLVFLALFGTVVGLMLSFGQVGLKLHRVEATKSHSIYAADGAIQYGVAQAKANQGVCPSTMTGAGLNMVGKIGLPNDVTSLNLKCQQYTGTGTNTFNGYAVVAGVNVNNNGQFVANSGPGSPLYTCSPAQTSISSDPVGSGAPTFASGTRSCQKYPAAGAIPPWTQNITPDPTAVVNGTFVLTPIEQFYVGTHVVSGSTVPFVWFAPDSDDYSDATGAGGSPLPSDFVPAKVWAAGFGQVFVVGTEAGAGAVFLSSDSENAATPGGLVHWNQQAIPNAKTITDIYGLSDGTVNNVWAVGTTIAPANTGAIWHFDSATWTQVASLTSSTAATGVWASDATHVFVSGTSGGRGAIWTNANWATVTTVANTVSFADVRGIDATHVWAVGVSNNSPGRGAISTYNGTNWSASNFTGTTAFTTVLPLSPTEVWVFGANGAAAAKIYCNNDNAFVANTCTPANSWNSQGLPIVTPPAINDASGLKVTNDNVTPPSHTYVISVVGAKGTVLSYAPLNAGGCQPYCLSRVQGSVFNANGANLASGLCLQLSTSPNCNGNPSGSFTQYSTGSCPTKPNFLAPTLPTPVPYGCTNTLPAFTPRPLPTAKPAAAANQGGTFVSGTGNACRNGGGYYYFTPGTYTHEIDFLPHRTYFFESGVYVFEGTGSNVPGFGPFDNLTNPPDANDLWVIGGKPSPGDTPAFAQNSPCWGEIQANSAVWNGGSGTGVLWIMAKATWLDVHTVNLELFTREGGPASEGPQGMSVRDVSGVTAASSPWGSDLNNRVAPNMVLQVDANSPLHYPNVYIHGSIYLPNENVEEYTNPQNNLSGPVLGAIFANSIEFSYADTQQLPLVVSSGSAGSPTAVFTATTGPVTVQSFVPFDATTTPALAITDPTKGYSWRVLSPS